MAVIIIYEKKARTKAYYTGHIAFGCIQYATAAAV